MRRRTTMSNLEAQQSDDQSVTSEQASQRQLEADICVHIFSVSATLVGICLTVIGFLRVVVNARKAEIVVDDFLALDAVFFLRKCFRNDGCLDAVPILS